MLKNNYIRGAIPFAKEVVAQIENRNVGLNRTEKRVIGLLVENTGLTSVELAEIIGVTKRPIERSFNSCKKGK